MTKTGSFTRPGFGDEVKSPPTAQKTRAVKMDELFRVNGPPTMG